MLDRQKILAEARRLGSAPYDSGLLRAHLAAELARFRFDDDARRRAQRAVTLTLDLFDTLEGESLALRWRHFEERHWPRWVEGRERLALGDHWTWGVWALVGSRLVQPSFATLSPVRVNQWLDRLPEDDPLLAQRRLLHEMLERCRVTGTARQNAVVAGLRLLLSCGRDELAALSVAEVATLPFVKGADGLDLVLCELGVLARGPLRGGVRAGRIPRRSGRELVACSGIPDCFAEAVACYLETYESRVSTSYATLRHKCSSLAHFFTYLSAEHGLTSVAEVRPQHGRGFLPWAKATAAGSRRRSGGQIDEGESMTAYSWAIEVRTFFADLASWGSEPGSPLGAFVPLVVPLDRHDLTESGLLQAKRTTAARMTAVVLDLEREMPKLRAFALRRWHESKPPEEEALSQRHEHRRAFWDWALLELLCASGLRVEEACELTTFDVLRRELRDGRRYYLLHVKPSKFGQARFVPIGDVLGRVLAEIIREVRAFYGTDAVPFCDRRDQHEKVPLPRAPYLLQGFGHPSAIGTNTVRYRLAKLSEAAGLRRTDGSPLVLRPHDCRRVFASEQLNNNTPVHVIAALLGHATLDTVMVYAKLYPSSLVDGYRQAMRSLYADVYGQEARRAPSVEEWTAFSASCSLRDMGTHICALPTGEHCSRGLVCLGCGHAQPKRSALPVFKRMLGSHERALVRARQEGEPAGQIAARELEVERIASAMRRASELTEGVAEALEAV